MKGVHARTASDHVGLDRRTAILFYCLRLIIAQQVEDEWVFA